MKRILLIRHGRTAANDRRLYCGSTDLPLSPEGRAALEELCRRGGYPAPTGFHVVTSGMRRAEETLSILYGEIEHRRIPDLREVDFGAFEMRGYEELRQDSAYTAWCEGENWRNVPPGGESGESMKNRVLSAFRTLAEEDGDLLIVSHGGPIAAIMEELFPDEGKNLYEWQPGHGRGYQIVLDGQERSWKPVPERGQEHE